MRPTATAASRVFRALWSLRTAWVRHSIPSWWLGAGADDVDAGELSALNGIAGAHSEQVKVIHVVGQTTRQMQKNRVMIHHSISSDPDHSVRMLSQIAFLDADRVQVYSKMSKLARVAEAALDDVDTAPAEIDVNMLPSIYGATD